MKRRILSGILTLSMLISLLSFFLVTADEGDVLLHYTFEKPEEGWSYWDTKTGAEGT